MGEIFYVTNLELKYDGNKEYLDVGTRQFLLDKGDILFTLFDIPDSVLLHIEQNIRHEKELLTERFHEFDNHENWVNDFKGMMSRDKVLTKFLDQISFEWEELNKHDSLWGLFIFLYPLIKIQMSYRLQYGYQTNYETRPAFVYSYKTEPFKAFAEEMSYSFKQFKNNPLESTKKLFSNKDTRTYSEKLYDASVNITETFLGNVLMIPVEFDQQSIYFDALIEYADSILTQIREIRSIKDIQSYYVAERTNAYPSSFEEYPDWVKQSLNNAARHLSALSITELVAKEQNFYINEKSYIKTCKLCGRLFIGSKTNSLYCDRPNPTYPWQTCKQVSIRNTTKKENPLFKQYDSNRKIYRNWMGDNLKKHTNLNNTDISKEMESNYVKWNSLAQNAMSDFDSNKITLDEAMKLIVLPAVEDRSPLLYKLLHK